MADRSALYSDHQITEAMIAFGGSFVQGLAVLYRRADADNRTTLKAAFPEVFAEYADPMMQARLAAMNDPFGNTSAPG